MTKICQTLRKFLKKSRKSQNSNTKKDQRSKSQSGIKLFSNPQKKAICVKIQTMSPKKPNSANRRIAKVKLFKIFTFVTVKIPGEKHGLQQHSTLLVHGGRSRDLIGVHLKAIRGKYDLTGVVGRKRARSIYGVKKA